jgi:hypothetical protein
MLRNMPDFAVFERKNARVSRDPSFTITVRGTLNLNKPAFELLGKPQAVVLLYARPERVIGLRPAPKDETNAYLVRPLGAAGSAWTVVAREFCAWIGADLAEARRYALTAGPDGLGCVDLNSPARVVTGSRARKAKR